MKEGRVKKGGRGVFASRRPEKSNSLFLDRLARFIERS